MDTDLLTEDLMRDEDFVSHAYKDSEGYLTIGYGHLIDKRLGGGIPESIAMLLLEYDIAVAELECQQNFDFWDDLGEPQQRAVCNMAHNLGLPRLRGFKRMIAALGAHDYDKAATEAMDSLWARQVGDRANRVADLMRSD